MTTFRVRHRTSYSYDRPVEFGLRQLMVRPRDGHDMRLLAVTPRTDVRWAFDTFGNSIALLSFSEAADELVIPSELTLRRYGYDDPVPRLARHTGPYPFAYEAEDGVDLALMLTLQHPGDRTAVEEWMAASLPVPPGETIGVLDALCRAIHSGFAYGRRELRGVQSPAETITLGRGTCRDFAVLFMEAARARLCGALRHRLSLRPGKYRNSRRDSQRRRRDPRLGGCLRPGGRLGRVRPDERIVAGRNLIRVATTRSPSQALPLGGNFNGPGATCLGMDVHVSVEGLE